jgi:predicted dehydrogenase
VGSKSGFDSNFRLDISSYSRRQFNAWTAAALAAGPWTLAHGAKRTVPSDRLTIGVIGLGSRGFNLLDEFLRLPDCQVVAVCDVAKVHHRDLAWGKGRAYGREPAARLVQRAYSTSSVSGAVRVFTDYRELIAADGVDAVVVATPDHWHALCTYEAIENGKDVYCEKPVTHLFAEGQRIVAKVAERSTIFQTGSQQRSDPLFQRAVLLARNGVLGELKSFEVGLPAGYDKAMGSTEVIKPRPDLDYNQWCGPGELLPFMQARHHRWWRGHTAFGGGVLMDWIGHHNDIAHWAIGMERSGPTRVSAEGWTFPQTNVYDTPHHYTIRCEYSSGVTSSISSRNQEGLKIVGSDGWVFVRRGYIEASEPRWLQSDFHAGSFEAGRSVSHAEDFLAGVRSRRECIAPAEIGHRSITPGHLGYVSHAIGGPVNWDPERETIVGDEPAMKLLSAVSYRSPWKLPVVKASV